MFYRAGWSCTNSSTCLWTEKRFFFFFKWHLPFLLSMLNGLDRPAWRTKYLSTAIATLCGSKLQRWRGLNGSLIQAPWLPGQPEV